MADLFNQQISATYSGLLKTTSNGVLSASLAQITDGRGNGSQLYLSTSKINFYNAYEFPTSDGSANQVLKTDGSGVLTWEDDANTGGVQVSGTPTTNQIAIWTNATTIKGMSALEIDTNDKITLTQGTNNYYLGGGNLANNNGEGNVGLGNDVFRVQTSGNFNIGIGNFAFYDFITGVRNIGIGYNSFSNTIGCSSNVGVGASTLAYSTGDNNTALGDSALGNSSFTGANNTAIGFDSGKSITTGSNNVILGSNTGNTIATSSNNIIISDGSGNNRIQVDSGGNVGIGVTPTDAHQISRTSGTTQDAKNIQLRIGSSTTSLAPYIRFQGQTSSSVNRFADIQLDTVNDLLSFFPPSQYANAPSALNISSVGDATFSGDVEIKNSVVPTLKLNNTDTSLGSQTLGSIEYYQNDASDQGVGTVSRINCVNESSFAGLGALTFETGNATSITERLRISSGGDVLINATSKHNVYTNFTTLKLSSDSGDYCPILEFSGNRDQGNGNQNAMIQFWNKTSTAVEVGRITSSQGSGVNYGELQFATASNGTLTERLRISSGGNLTIGTAAAQDFYLALRGGVGGFFGWDDSANKTIVQAPNTRALSFQVNSDTFGSGTEALTISSAAKVGVGVSPDTNSKLTIKGSGDSTTSNSIAVYNSTNASIFTVVDNGAVSIGGSFSIVPSSASSTVRIQPDVDNNAYLGLINRRYIAVYAVNGSIQTSDIREKTEIKTIKLGLDFINDLNPVSYKWKDCKRLQGYENIKDERNHQGLIAQEFAETLEKHGINKNEFGGLDIQKTEKYDDFHGMTYSQLIAPMIKAIQEQQTIIEDLKSRIETLEG